ncbi:MAG: hypothetical protein B7X04_02360 [Parcubacteria group bacterium 21-54-25]|nr:MAG: hypothetical protein B7X04_02360 [Parcubacteria group bacterium 21-54-25]HQU07890.1 PH domain-containing protein [Candidatus Paceibacterota bacterium]
MIDQQVVTYVRQQFAGGATTDAIQQALRTAGWNDESIRAALAAAQGVPAAPIATAPAPTPQASHASGAFAKAGTSAFQAQYPLSVRRKFWKKLLSQTIGWGITVFLPTLVLFIGGLIYNLPALTFTGLVLFVPYFVALALYAWYVKAYIRLYYYNDNESFITIRKGVFTPQEIHVQYPKVQDVYVDQDLIDRLLGLYDVHLASATVTSGMEAHIDGVNADIAGRLKDVLLSRVQGNARSFPESPQAGPQTHPTESAQPRPGFHGNISNSEYPIQGTWLTGRIISAVLHGMVWGVIVGVWANYNISLGVLVFLVVSVFQAGYVLIWKKNYRFQFLPEYILVHTGVISWSDRHIPYNTIQDVNLSQPIWGRMFGFANVRIENATQGGVGSINIPGQTLVNAGAITDALKSIILTKDSSRTGL